MSLSDSDLLHAGKGAKTPGIDGITKNEMQKALDENLAQIRNDLRSGQYQWVFYRKNQTLLVSMGPVVGKNI